MSERYSLDLEILWLPPINSARNVHWRQKKRERDNAQNWVSVHLRSHLPPRPLDRIWVRFTRRSSRRPDRVNLAESFKAVLDSLVVAGVVRDDSEEHVDDHYRWEKASPSEGSIRIEVQER